MTSGQVGPPEPLFTVSGAARRLGIPAGTLRTWERRHGIGPSARSSGGHRRYGWADLVRLRAMRTLIEAGIAPTPAARLAILAAGEAREHAGAAGAGAAAGGQAGEMPGGAGDAASAMIPAETVVRAALDLDAPLLYAMVNDAFSRHGVPAAWEHLAVPALTEVGHGSPPAGNVAAEHMLSGCVLSALLTAIAAAPPVASLRPVLLSCAEDEQHLLAVYALQAVLAARGVDVRQLGGRVPAGALAHAVTAVSPSAVFVWAQVPATAHRNVFGAVPPGPLLVVGGPGWRGREPGPPVRFVDSLTAAADLVAQAAFAAS